MKPKDEHILFVCTGNVCRSPMAEYILRHRLGGKSGVTVESAGVIAPQGMPASAEAADVLEEWRIDISQHRSRMLTRELVEAATLILVMTEQHRKDVLSAFPAREGARLSAEVVRHVGAGRGYFRSDRPAGERVPAGAGRNRRSHFGPDSAPD